MKTLLAEAFISGREAQLELRNVTSRQKILIASMVAVFMIAAMFLLATV